MVSFSNNLRDYIDKYIDTGKKFAPDIMKCWFTPKKTRMQPYHEKIFFGFKNDDAILTAPETRSSSPIRIVRDETYQTNIKGIFPCGEGSGYSSGITTSALDGIRVADKDIKDILNS